MQNTIGPALLEHADALLETMKEVREQIEKQEARIGELDKLRDEDAGEYLYKPRDLDAV